MSDIQSLTDLLLRLNYTEAQARKFIDESVRERLNRIRPVLEQQTPTERIISLVAVIVLAQKEKIEELEREAKASRSRYDAIDIQN